MTRWRWLSHSISSLRVPSGNQLRSVIHQCPTFSAMMPPPSKYLMYTWCGLALALILPSHGQTPFPHPINLRILRGFDQALLRFMMSPGKCCWMFQKSLVGDRNYAPRYFILGAVTPSQREYQLHYTLIVGTHKSQKTAWEKNSTRPAIVPSTCYSIPIPIAMGHWKLLLWGASFSEISNGV